MKTKTALCRGCGSMIDVSLETPLSGGTYSICKECRKKELEEMKGDTVWVNGTEFTAKMIEIVYEERNDAYAEIEELRNALKRIADPYDCVTVDIAWLLARRALDHTEEK